MKMGLHKIKPCLQGVKVYMSDISFILEDKYYAKYCCLIPYFEEIYEIMYVTQVIFE